MSWVPTLRTLVDEPRLCLWNAVGLTSTVISFNACVAFVNAIENKDMQRLGLRMVLCVALSGVALSLILNALQTFASAARSHQMLAPSKVPQGMHSCDSKPLHLQRQRLCMGHNVSQQDHSVGGKMSHPGPNSADDVSHATSNEESIAKVALDQSLSHVPPKIASDSFEEACEKLPSAVHSLAKSSGLLPTPTELIEGMTVYWLDSPSRVRAACDFLLNESTVAIDCEGLKLSKHGELCLVAIATLHGYIFLFDICSLGDSAFTFGLRQLLESPKIRKVFQDARQDVDALYWQFGVSVASIWDTQIADAIHRWAQRQRVEFVLGLPKLMSKYCPKHAVAALVLDVKRVVNDQVNKEPGLWRERPLRPALLEYAVIDVFALLPLWTELRSSLRSAAKWLPNRDIEDTVMSISGAYAESFKQVPYACVGAAFARFPQHLLDGLCSSFTTVQVEQPPGPNFVEVDWDSGCFFLEEVDVPEQVCKEASLGHAHKH